MLSPVLTRDALAEGEAGVGVDGTSEAHVVLVHALAVDEALGLGGLRRAEGLARGRGGDLARGGGGDLARGRRRVRLGGSGLGTKDGEKV